MHPPPSADTICALASPPGEGAIGVLRISGGGARALLERASSGPEIVARRMQHRRLVDPRSGRLLDAVLACWMPGPRSYTGEDVVEIFGHGGGLNMRRLSELFVALGARPATPGEFTRRAFINGRMDLTQAEAVAEVIAARSERALGNAQALLSGELGRRVGMLRQGALELAAELEVSIDFADEFSASEMAGRGTRHTAQLVPLLASIDELLATAERGARLDGVSVAFVGDVNAGKSSIFNALLRTHRALVASSPGTTRDYLEAEVVWRGVCVTLVDTAGERQGLELSEIERQGQLLGSARVARCDLGVRLLDGTRLPVSPEQFETARELVVVSKADRLAAAQRGAWRDLLGAPLFTSVESGEGLDELVDVVINRLFPADGGQDGVETLCVTQQRQLDALTRARAGLVDTCCALEANLPPELCVEHMRVALAAFGEVTGEEHSEAVLDALFARFCIGK